MCNNFGHPAQTSSFTKYNFFSGENNFATFENEPSVLKLFQLSNGYFYLCSLPTTSKKCLNLQKNKVMVGRPKLGHTTQYINSFIYKKKRQKNVFNL